MVRTVTAGEGAVDVPSDEDLILGLRDGDRDCLNLLVARWQEPLFRFTCRLLERREDARDICQETFLRVLRQSERFEEGSRFSTWMYQIALNLCRDQLRRRRRWRFLPAFEDRSEADGRGGRHDSAGYVEPDALEALARRERRVAVTRALRELPREQREVLVLKEFEGLKFREIALVVGCPESTVKSRMYYGLSSLRSALARQGIDGV